MTRKVIKEKRQKAMEFIKREGTGDGRKAKRNRARIIEGRKGK
jgi:hypothetical protein